MLVDGFEYFEETIRRIYSKHDRSEDTLRRRPLISGIFVSQLRSAFRSILLGLSRGEMDAVFGTDVALNIALQLKCC